MVSEIWKVNKLNIYLQNTSTTTKFRNCCVIKCTISIPVDLILHSEKRNISYILRLIAQNSCAGRNGWLRFGRRQRWEADRDAQYIQLPFYN